MYRQPRLEARTPKTTFNAELPEPAEHSNHKISASSEVSAMIVVNSRLAQLQRSSRSFAAHGNLFPTDLRGAERSDDVVSERLGNLDQREVIGHFDRADRSRRDAGFTGNRSDQITGSDAALSAGAEKQPNHRSSAFARTVCSASYGATSAAIMFAEPVTPPFLPPPPSSPSRLSSPSSPSRRSSTSCPSARLRNLLVLTIARGRRVRHSHRCRRDV